MPLIELPETFFGKLPYEQEREIAKGIYQNIEEIIPKIFIPYVIVDKDELILLVKDTKNKLIELGI